MFRKVERNGVAVTEWLPESSQDQPSVSIAEVILHGHVYPPARYKEACNTKCDVAIYVVSGLIKLTMTEHGIVLKTGDAAYIPKGVWYKIERIYLNTILPAKLVHTASPPYSTEQHTFR